MSIHFPKGEGFKIIHSRAEATVNDTVYILPLDDKTATIIIRSRSGAMREVGITLPENLASVDLFDTQGNTTSEGTVYLKSQVDTALKGVSDSLANELVPRIKASEDKEVQQDAALQAETSARLDGDTALGLQISNETTERTLADAAISQNISDLQSIVGSLNTWRTGLTNADADNIVDTLTELLQVMQNVPEGADVYGVLASKVNISSIVNNLTTSVANVPLSAQQGVVLKGLIDGLQTAISQETTDRKTAVAGLQTAFDTVVPQLLFKPTASAADTTTTYTNVVLVDANGNTAKYAAGALGKNIANSALTSVAAASFTLGAAYTWNTAGYPLYITNLPDKSSDSTYNLLHVQNSAGQMAVSNGKSILKAIPSTFSAQELTDWKTAMNGGWTTNTMSIGVISPPLVNNTKNANTWFVVKGANLNLPPNSFKVEIVDNAGTTVIATVPNSQVQLFNNGTDLIFYYNCNGFPTGNSKVRLWNGVSYYVSPMTVLVTSNTQPLNLGLLNWNVITANGATSSKINGNGSVAAISPDANIKSLASDLSIIAALKSDKLFDADKDFYLQYNISYNSNGYIDSSSFFTGLILDNTPNSLINNNIFNILMKAAPVYQQGSNMLILNGTWQSGGAQGVGKAGNQLIEQITIIRRGNVYSIIMTDDAGFTGFYTITAPSGAVAFSILGQNAAVAYNGSIILNEAYILN